MAHIDTENYLNPGYDDKGRFISYHDQVTMIRDCRPESVLEIGVGNKTLIHYLRQHGIAAVSCDADEKLGPDHVGDIRDLPFDDKRFDTVCAFQILEHIPWEEVGTALCELARVSRQYVIISVPFTPVSIEMVVRSSLFYRLFRRWELSLFLNLGFITRKWKYDGTHYWEMGKRNYPRKKIRKLLKKYFRITREKKTDLSYQYFFVLEKK